MATPVKKCKVGNLETERHPFRPENTFEGYPIPLANASLFTFEQNTITQLQELNEINKF